MARSAAHSNVQTLEPYSPSCGGVPLRPLAIPDVEWDVAACGVSSNLWRHTKVWCVISDVLKLGDEDSSKVLVTALDLGSD